MKVKLGDLKNIIDGLGILASKELPIKHSYWISKTIPVLAKEFQNAEANRYKLCIKHCKKDDNGSPITRMDGNNKVYDMIDQEAFNIELADLWNLEIDIKFNPIPIEQLDGIKIDTVTLIKLDGFIITEEDKNNVDYAKN